jgi:hypothetical protein
LVAMYIESTFQGLFGLCVAAVIAVAITGAILWLLNKSLELNLTRDVAKVFPQAAPLLATLE